MVLSPGQSLQKGKYEVVRELGRGRFGITYLVKRNDGERWVIKTLNPDVLKALPDPERERLETMVWQEAVKLARCSGTRHIVQAEMPFKEGDAICLPMEYVDGRSLGDRAQRQVVEDTALEYIRQIGEALEMVHDADLVHRDIRPDNILLRILPDSSVEAVLIDFGLAMACDTELTRTRRKEVSDGFSPIELYGRGRTIAPYTDVYSLAATLYELLAGEAPTSAEIRKLEGKTIESPQSKNPEISAQTTKAILKGLELEPDKRPKTVDVWLKLLNLNQKETQSSAQRQTDWGKWQTIWAAAAVFVAIIAIIVPTWLALRSSKPQPIAPNPSPTQSSPY